MERLVNSADGLRAVKALTRDDRGGYPGMGGATSNLGMGQSMGFKNLRFADRLRSAPAHDIYRSTHVCFGGTGAVGGTTLIKMLDIIEEMMTLKAPRPGEIPVLVATGRTKAERKGFHDRVRRFLESRAGGTVQLTPYSGGWLTPSGILLSLADFDIAPFPSLSGIKDTPEHDRPHFVHEALRAVGIDPNGPHRFEELRAAVGKARPFRAFLEALRLPSQRPDGSRPFRSVLVGIPLPSLVAYTEDWEAAGAYLGGFAGEQIEALKSAFEGAVRDDLAAVRDELADELIVAHTTSVGGMYDEVMGPKGEPKRSIRLGFSHSARDQRLIEKQRSAERLTREYAGSNVKVFITAAAIGVDDVLIRQEVPIHRAAKAQLRDVAATLPDPAIAREDASAVRGAARRGGAIPAPHAQVRIFRPWAVALDNPEPEPIPFARVPAAGRPVKGDLLRPAYAVRSGENGVFTVANADALYRVMRVASASELALVLATVALFGDDPQHPFFKENVCYYTETDNSRQVAAFLDQPPLRHMQLSGLEPMALQDLGSAKHQGELHTLGLLILLHRLRTLDVDAIPPYVDAERFDARAFFEQHSRPLTFEDVDAWELESLTGELRTLVTAEKAEDLDSLTRARSSHDDLLFAEKRKARLKILAEVLRSVWAVPSLGSPIVYEHEGIAWLRTGFYLAPIERVLTSTGDISAWLRRRVAEGPGNTYEDVRDFNLCVGGFIDLRAHAIVCTSKTDEVDLAGKITRVRDEPSLRAALARIRPYDFFATCGLLAVLFRLRALYGVLKESMIELGTLHEFRWQMPRDENGHLLVLPGAVEALRMVSEGLEKTTGTERADGIWGYERRHAPNRLAELDL
jgi:hypothetical protein